MYDQDDDDGSFDWEHIHWCLTEISLLDVDALPDFEPSCMMSGGLPEHWEMLFWNLRLDGLTLKSCAFTPIGGLPNGAGVGTHIKVSIRQPSGGGGEGTLEAVLDDKTLEVHAVAPQWYWKYRWSVPSPIPKEIESLLR